MSLQVLEISCEVLQPIRNALRWIFPFHPVFFFLAFGFPKQVCHVDLSLGLVVLLPILRNVLIDPVVSMWRTSCCRKMLTVLAQQEVRNYLSCK